MAKNDFDEPKSGGIDIGKDVFYLVGFDYDGRLVLRREIKRFALATTFQNLPCCIVNAATCPNSPVGLGGTRRHFGVAQI